MSEPTPQDREARLAEALGDFHRRRALGQRVRADEYQGALGDLYEEFCALIETDSVVDAAIDAPSHELLPRAFGHYELLRVLGEGSAGVVYEAVDRRLGRVVALKVLRQGFELDERQARRFRDEGRTLAQVRHDHVVALFEAGEAEGRPYYAMDLVRGETLHALAKQGRAPEPKAVCEGLAGIADALGVLHAMNVFHRDVKPSNIMVREDGRMVLADFGLARSPDRSGVTHSGDMLGTPSYMSPEQVLGQREAVDARTDVYGLGATLYEALAGQPPFRATEVAAVLRLILTERPPTPRAVNPSVPVDAERIVLKCLEKDPADRYGSAAAVAEDLRAFAQGGLVRGGPVSPALRAVRVVGRRWRVVAAAAVVLAAAALWWSRRPAVLEVEGFAPHEVTVAVDGVVRGVSPITLEVPPGRHRLEFSRDRFRPLVEERDFVAGGHYSYSRTLDPVDRSDPVTLAMLLEGVGAPPALPSSRTRGAPPSDGPVAEPLWPAGDARMGDLAHLAFVLDVDRYRPPVRVVLRRGGDDEGELLAPPVVVEPEIGRVLLPFPAAAREALKPGDAFVWRVETPSVEGVPPARAVAVRVVADDPAAVRALAAVAERLDFLPAASRAYLRAMALRRAGLVTAALVEAHEAARADPQAKVAWRGVREGLAALGLLGGTWFAECTDQEAWPDAAPPPLLVEARPR